MLQEGRRPHDHPEAVEGLPDGLLAGIRRLVEDKEHEPERRGQPEPLGEEAEEGKVERVLGPKVVEQASERRRRQPERRRRRPALLQRTPLALVVQRKRLVDDARALEPRQLELRAASRVRRLEDGCEQLRPRRAREKVRVGSQLEEGVHAPPVGRVGGAAALGSAQDGAADGGVERGAGVQAGVQAGVGGGRRALEAEARLDARLELHRQPEPLGLTCKTAEARTYQQVGDPLLRRVEDELRLETDGGRAHVLQQRRARQRGVAARHIARVVGRRARRIALRVLRRK